MMEEKSKGERTQDKIVKAAHRLILEQGYHGTSMRQIAEQAGIALGGIYNHFASKEDIFEAVVMTYHPYHEILPVLEAAQGETIEALFLDAAKGLRPILEGRGDLFNIMFIELIELEGQHIAQLFEIIFPQMIGFAQKLAQAKGKLRPMPLPNLMRAFIGAMFSTMLMEQLMGGQFPDEVNAQAYDDTVNIFLRGILEE